MQLFIVLGDACILSMCMVCRLHCCHINCGLVRSLDFGSTLNRSSDFLIHRIVHVCREARCEWQLSLARNFC